MDKRRVKELIALARERGVGELEFGEGLMRVSFKLKPSPPGRAPGSQAAAGSGAAPQADSAQASGHWIRSPMVGLFRSEDGFVAEGSTVAAGDVIGHVESMGILNEVTSDVAGVVSKVEIGDGDPVEYGQALVLVHTGAAKRGR